MKKILICLATICYLFAANAQSGWPDNIKYLSVASNDSAETEGNLSDGKLITDLSWASRSSIACFTAAQFPKYQGPHVFFGTVIKPGSIVKIKVKPVVETEELSLYGYMMDHQEYTLVPRLEQCINCEADYKRDKPMKGKQLTNEREIEFRNPTGSSYNIIIGVSAPKGVTERKFILTVKSIS